MLGRHDELDLSGTQPSSSSSFHLRSRFEPFLLTMLIKPTIAAGRHLARQHHCAGLAPALTPRTFTMTKPSDDDDDDDGDDDDDEGREGKARWITRPTTATTGTPRPAPWATITGQHYGPARRASTTGQHDGPARRASTTGQLDGPAPLASTTGQHGHNAGCSW
jgi:hypothetical protein